MPVAFGDTEAVAYALPAKQLTCTSMTLSKLFLQEGLGLCGIPAQVCAYNGFMLSCEWGSLSSMYEVDMIC